MLIGVGICVFHKVEVGAVVLVDHFTPMPARQVVDPVHILRIGFEEVSKRNFTLTGDDVIDGWIFHHGLPIVCDFRSAQQDFSIRTDGLDFIDDRQCLGDVPDIAAEADHFIGSTMVGDKIRIFFDHEFFPMQTFIRLVQFIEKPDGQVHVDVLGIQRSQ